MKRQMWKPEDSFKNKINAFRSASAKYTPFLNVIRKHFRTIPSAYFDIYIFNPGIKSSTSSLYVCAKIFVYFSKNYSLYVYLRPCG